MTDSDIPDLHWSEDEQMYCDVSVDGNGPSVHNSVPLISFLP